MNILLNVLNALFIYNYQGNGWIRDIYNSKSCEKKKREKKMTTFFKHDRALVKIIPFCCFVAVFLTSPTNIDL
jgi:hypothetical protein